MARSPKVRNRSRGPALCFLFCAFFLIAVALVVSVAVPFAFESARVVPRRNHVYSLPTGVERSSLNEDLFTFDEDGGKVKAFFYVRRDAHAERALNASISSSCCDYIVPEAKLIPGMGYDIDVEDAGVLGASFVRQAFSRSQRTLEAVVGTGYLGRRREAQFLGLTRNGKNQKGFGELSVDIPGALAVTAIWVRCSNAAFSVNSCPGDLQIFEWKVVFEIRAFEWGDAATTFDVHDLESVSTHEDCHVYNLNDLRLAGCEESTMWFSSSKGEILKRSLDSSTVRCLRELYGAEEGEGEGEGEGGGIPSSGKRRKPGRVFGLARTLLLWWVFVL